MTDEADRQPEREPAPPPAPSPPHPPTGPAVVGGSPYGTPEPPSASPWAPPAQQRPWPVPIAPPSYGTPPYPPPPYGPPASPYVPSGYRPTATAMYPLRGWPQARAPEPPPHSAPTPYHRLLRTWRARWWRPLLGLLFFAVTWGIASVVVTLAVVLTAWVSGIERDPEVALLDLTSPVALLTGNLVLGLAIPAALLTVFVVHRERIGWLHSVVAGLRWSLLWRYAMVALVVIAGINAVVLALLPEPIGGVGEVNWPGWSAYLSLAAVVLVTTPLQAAGEEYAFRGYLTQALGVWLRWPIVIGLITSTLFAFAHGSQDIWLFLDRFAFGALAALLAQKTGGLEAPIALHAVNNMVIFFYVAAVGQLEESLLGTTLPWQILVIDVGSLAVFGWIALRIARARDVAVLAGPTGPIRMSAVSAARAADRVSAATPAGQPTQPH